MVLQYQVFPLAEFSQQIEEFESLYAGIDAERKRIEAIVELYRNGAMTYPVFLQQNDPKRRIIEGTHRSVALRRCGSLYLPTFVAGYRNWFFPDLPANGFEREDEITTASKHDVYGFFMNATRSDHRGIEIALFDGARLRLCDVSYVAKYDGKIIGAVTLTVGKGKPTLSTVYVLRQFRRKGVAYRLCEKALLRFKDAGVQDVFCDVQSVGMEATLEQIGRERPELRALLKVHIGYLPGEEDIEMGLGE